VRDLVVVIGLAERERFGLDERHSVLREVAAGGEEEVLVLRRRVQQGFVEFQPEGNRLADELRVVVASEYVPARRQRAGDHADRLVFDQPAADRRRQQARHYERLDDFQQESHLRACRNLKGAGPLPIGAQYYAFRARAPLRIVARTLRAGK
jgi:hypothetical protein